ncbi:MAG: hypothetical protein RIR48_2999 [Bacteroidota bacterium]
MQSLRKEIYYLFTRQLIPNKEMEGKPDVILYLKANRLHELILILAFFVSLLYVIVSTLQGKYDEAIIDFVPMPFTLFCYFLYRKGYVFLSKIINIHVIIAVISALCLKTSPVTGIMAFFIPIFIGAQIIFQGRERKYAYFSNASTFLLMLLIFWADAVTRKDVVSIPNDFRTEWFLNYSGAVLVSVIEIVFLIKITNRLQSELILKETQRKQLEQQVLEQAVNQQKLITEITLQSQEKEKSELGLELHDNINQILAAAKMYLDLYIAKIPATDPSIQRSHDHVERALHEIRKLSHSLVTPSLGAERDLFEAIKDLVSDQTTESNIAVYFHNELEPGLIISETRKIVYYRIVQEQMTNILKYANASRVNITLGSVNDSIYLRIEDNGKGFEQNLKTKGIGLKNIKSRVQLYSGDMRVVSEPGKGCLLDVSISNK